MSKPHEYRTEFEIYVAGHDLVTLDLAISYSVVPGTPETERTYMMDPARYDPGSPDVLEIGGMHLSMNGKEINLPRWLDLMIGENAALRDAILTDWREHHADTGPEEMLR